jgi:ribose 5-phosphate isomerase B
MMAKILVGCDGAAAALKDKMVERLREAGWEVEDFGVASEADQTPYPEVAARVCRAVQRAGPGQRALLLCGTGIGMSIAANKFKGIYATPIHDPFSAERAALSNDANVATLGARVVGEKLAAKLLFEWLSHEYKSGPSDAKLAVIKRFENENFK